ncbi:hypothetical protein ACHQM5_006540 [Ranunculus cassubicifolius]
MSIDYTIVPCKGGNRKAYKGFKFCPKDWEAVSHYLMNKAWGRDLPCDIIQEIDFYSYNPDQLPIRDFILGKEGEAYFFTYNRRNRSTSRGYWEEISGDVEIVYNNEVIGYKKTLAFYWGTPRNAIQSDYVMKEYRLNPCFSVADSSIKNNVCTVQRLYFPLSYRVLT